MSFNSNNLKFVQREQFVSQENANQVNDSRSAKKDSESKRSRSPRGDRQLPGQRYHSRNDNNDKAPKFGSNAMIVAKSFDPIEAIFRSYKENCLSGKTGSDSRMPDVLSSKNVDYRYFDFTTIQKFTGKELEEKKLQLAQTEIKAGTQLKSVSQNPVFKNLAEKLYDKFGSFLKFGAYEVKVHDPSFQVKESFFVRGKHFPSHMGLQFVHSVKSSLGATAKNFNATSESMNVIKLTMPRDASKVENFFRNIESNAKNTDLYNCITATFRNVQEAVNLTHEVDLDIVNKVLIFWYCVIFGDNDLGGKPEQCGPVIAEIHDLIAVQLLEFKDQHKQAHELYEEISNERIEEQNTSGKQFRIDRENVHEDFEEEEEPLENRKRSSSNRAHQDHSNDRKRSNFVPKEKKDHRKSTFRPNPERKRQDASPPNQMEIMMQLAESMKDISARLSELEKGKK